METSPTDRSGLPYALAAYGLWGLMPLYLMLVVAVPALEFLAWRILWTVPVCFVLIALRGQFKQLFAALSDRKMLGWLALSGLLIGINWLAYIIAIIRGEIYGASLGYYINPLINVVIGTALFGERMGRLGWVAVGLASVGVAILLAGALSTLWISLTLAFSFAFYGAVRKRLDVGSLPGLTVETLILAIPSIALLFGLSLAGQTLVFGDDPKLAGIIAGAGIVTAVPLLLFAVAARRLAYSTIGFIQFIAPTIVFLLGLFVFDQELRPVQMLSFAFIWSALAVFCAQLWLKSRAASAALHPHGTAR